MTEQERETQRAVRQALIDRLLFNERDEVRTWLLEAWESGWRARANLMTKVNIRSVGRAAQ